MGRISPDLLVGGLLFLVASSQLIYRLWSFGTTLFATRYSDSLVQWARWQQRNPWILFIHFTPLLVGGVYLLYTGVWLLLGRDGRGAVVVLAGIVLTISGGVAMLMPHRVAQATSESNQRIADRIRSHPCITAVVQCIVSAIAAVIGIAMLASALF